MRAPQSSAESSATCRPGRLHPGPASGSPCSPSPASAPGLPSLAKATCGRHTGCHLPAHLECRQPSEKPGQQGLGHSLSLSPASSGAHAGCALKGLKTVRPDGLSKLGALGTSLSHQVRSPGLFLAAPDPDVRSSTQLLITRGGPHAAARPATLPKPPARHGAGGLFPPPPQREGRAH